jgi:hypothetical protein
MNTRSVSTVSVAVLFALTATASAGPMSITNSKHIAPPQIQTEPVQYRYYGGYGYGGYGGWNSGAAIAGAALGLLSIGALAATAYNQPSYRRYAYHGRQNYRQYRYRQNRQYAYRGGIYTGRSVGYRQTQRGHYR